METNVIENTDPRFPTLLKEISDPPQQLYYKGEWEGELFKSCLTVVGTRRITSYGKRVIEHLVGDVARAGITIVSGFMYGVDATAHKVAMEVGGKTIAVMPCGIERIHPEYQKDLYERILEGRGLIVSEWEGSSIPQLWTYPRRNRIVAGLSKVTLVVEAGVESGSLITAEFARKFGRKVCAIPGPITSEVSKGTLNLIREGATIVGDTDDILKYYGENFQANPTERMLKTMTTIERRIFEVLERESLEADVLTRTLGISAAELGTTLSLMELQGIIKMEGGKYYINQNYKIKNSLCL